MADKKVGVVTHYYDKIGVAVVDLVGPLSAGDTIKVSGKSEEFTQVAESMEMDREKIEKAKKGQSVGLKVDSEVRKGDEVYTVQ